MTGAVQGQSQGLGAPWRSSQEDLVLGLNRRGEVLPNREGEPLTRALRGGTSSTGEGVAIGALDDSQIAQITGQGGLIDPLATCFEEGGQFGMIMHRHRLEKLNNGISACCLD